MKQLEKSREITMGRYKHYLMDQEDKFWNEMSKEIGECESLGEFQDAMKQHRDLVTFIEDDVLDIMIEDYFHEFWSDYAQSKLAHEVCHDNH
jgi:hypothetical protein